MKVSKCERVKEDFVAKPFAVTRIKDKKFVVNKNPSCEMRQAFLLTRFFKQKYCYFPGALCRSPQLGIHCQRERIALK
jgi:hypothetical protein